MTYLFSALITQQGFFGHLSSSRPYGRFSNSFWYNFTKACGFGWGEREVCSHRRGHLSIPCKLVCYLVPDGTIGIYARGLSSTGQYYGLNDRV